MYGHKTGFPKIGCTVLGPHSKGFSILGFVFLVPLVWEATKHARVKLDDTWAMLLGLQLSAGHVNLMGFLQGSQPCSRADS